MDRKTFFATAFKYAAGKGLDLVENNPLVRQLEALGKPVAPSRVRQRPPGAVDEQAFVQQCTGCDACMIACPVNAIMIEDLEARLPVIFPEEAACVHCSGYPCIAACPAAALLADNGHGLRLISE